MARTSAGDLYGWTGRSPGGKACGMVGRIRGGRFGRPAARAGRTAFTLVELLVVIGIIALLAAVLLPTLRMATESSRRASCVSNLNSIGKALLVYESQQNTYPYVPLNGAGWGVVVGNQRDIDPFGGAANDRSPSSCLYLLTRKKYTPQEMFICPSTREVSKKESVGATWDFAEGTAVSYALMCPYGPSRYFDSSLDGDVPILADSSPYFDPATGLRNADAIVDLTAPPDTETVMKGNSPNHRQDGQNVAVIGGSSRWYDHADVGLDRDNIYTRANEADGTDTAGSIPAAGADGSAADQGPANHSDSYLVQ